MSLGAVREALQQRICAKAVVAEEGEACVLIYCRRGGASHDLLVAAAEDRGWLYAKTVPETLVKPYMWHCRDIFYNPYGLYSFARTPEELAEKIASKLKRLEAQERLALHRLGLGED